MAITSTPLGAFDGGTNGYCTQFPGSQAGEITEQAANGCASGGNDNYRIFGHVDIPCELLGGHADRAIHADDLTIQVLVAENVFNESGVLGCLTHA